MVRPARRALRWLVALTAASFALPATAGAACTLTLILVPCIDVTWPSGSVAFGTVPAGTTTTSAVQTLGVSANTSWGIRVSADRTGGRPTEWNGSSYVSTSPKVMANPLQWARDGTSTYTDLSTTATSVLTGQSATSCVLGLACGSVNVGLRLRLRTSYSDRRASPNNYRLLVTYDARTGF